MDAFGVVAGGDEELACELGADAFELEEFGGCRLNDRGDLAVERFDLVVEGFPSPSEVTKRRFDAGDEHLVGFVDERHQLGCLWPETKAAVDEGSFREHHEFVTQRRWRPRAFRCGPLDYKNLSTKAIDVSN